MLEIATFVQIAAHRARRDIRFTANRRPLTGREARSVGGGLSRIVGDPPTVEWAYAHIAICERAAAGASTFSSKHGAPRSQDSAPRAACRQADASSRGEEQRIDPGVAGRFACPGLLRRVLVAMATYGLKH